MPLRAPQPSRRRVPAGALPGGADRLLEARERIMLAAAVADLRQELYRQGLLLEALFQALEEAGLLDADEVRARVSALDAAF